MSTRTGIASNDILLKLTKNQTSLTPALNEKNTNQISTPGISSRTFRKRLSKLNATLLIKFSTQAHL